MPTKQAIDRFLASDRIAMIGVSRRSKEFANSVFRDLQGHGYEMVPVNANADEIEGVKCYRSVAELPDVDGAIIMVPPAAAADVVNECADRGIARVWLHKGVGQGANTEEAVRAARGRGLDVVDGACPLMFVEPTGFIHRVHRRISGSRIATS